MVVSLCRVSGVCGSAERDCAIAQAEGGWVCQRICGAGRERESLAAVAPGCGSQFVRFQVELRNTLESTRQALAKCERHIGEISEVSAMPSNQQSRTSNDTIGRIITIFVKRTRNCMRTTTLMEI